MILRRLTYWFTIFTGLVLLCFIYSTNLQALDNKNILVAETIISGSIDIELIEGKAEVFNLKDGISRIAVGQSSIADYIRIDKSQIYILGKQVGQTNLLLWFNDGTTETYNISVKLNLRDLKNIITQELPEENNIKITSTVGSIVLSGTVSDRPKAKLINELTEAFLKNTFTTSELSKEFKVINLIKIKDPQQVLLEVVVASVDKSTLQQIGTKLATSNVGSTNYSILSASGGAGAATSAGLSSSIGPDELFFNLLLSNGNLGLGITADKLENYVQILAKPNIVTISGQEGRFLKGGRTFIPIAQPNGSVSLRKEEFGIGVSFLPTVMDGGRIHLKVSPEVSSISKSTIVSSSGASDSTIPIFDTKSVSTTVQLNNGDTLMIGGLLDEETIETINGIPVLKDIPILGALFRAQSTNKIQTELVVLVKTTLVESTNEELDLPTTFTMEKKLNQIEELDN